MDGTLVEASASLKSFKKKDAAPTLRRKIRQSRMNFTPTHAPIRECIDHRPGGPALSQGTGKRSQAELPGAHVDGESPRLAVQTESTTATGTAERDAAVTLMAAQAPAGGVTLGADKNYDTQGCVAKLRDAASLPTWRRTRGGAEAVPLMGVPRDIRAMSSVSGCASGWKKSLVG